MLIIGSAVFLDEEKKFRTSFAEQEEEEEEALNLIFVSFHFFYFNV